MKWPLYLGLGAWFMMRDITAIFQRFSFDQRLTYRLGRGLYFIRDAGDSMQERAVDGALYMAGLEFEGMLEV